MMRLLLACSIALFCLHLPCVVAAAPGENNVGMNVHLASGGELAAVAQMDLGWVRIDANWNIVETQDGQRNWAPIDRVIDDATALGMRVFATVGYTPPWASTGDRRGDGPGNDVPRVEPYARFMRDAAAHLRTKGVTHIGLWNEPNLEQFFEGSTSEYLDIIARPGIAAVREGCPDCILLGPEAANVGDVDDWLEDVLGAVGEDFDILSHHIYQGFDDCGLFSGDCFLNALEDRRSIFTRRDFRLVVAEAGLSAKEVWLSETGHRAVPPNAGDLADQEDFVRRVMALQLERNWWTNTFFYEITDCKPFLPDCNIDGYGFIRAAHTNGPQWPGDFETKPAFTALQQIVAETPALRDELSEPNPSAEPEPEPEPEPEAEPPTLNALRGSVTVDGNLDEWAGTLVRIPLERYVPAGTPGGGPGDLEASLGLRWDDDAFYIAVRAEDDVHHNSSAPDAIWSSDSVQFAMDPDASGGERYDGSNDVEAGFALASGASTGHVWAAPNGGEPAFAHAVRRVGAETHYEASVRFDSLRDFQPRTGALLPFSLLVNDDDGSGREGWLEWGSGIGQGKRPAAFGRVTLSAMTAVAPTPSPDASPSAGPTTSAAPTAQPSASGMPGGGGSSSGLPPLGTPLPSDNAPGPVSQDSGGCASARPAGLGALGALLGLAWLRRRRR